MGQIGAIKVNKENYLNFPVAFVIAKYPGAKNVVVLYTIYSLMVWTTVLHSITCCQVPKLFYYYIDLISPTGLLLVHLIFFMCHLSSC